MAKFVMALFLLSAFVASAEEQSGVCHVLSPSSWNWGTKKLVRNTKNIFIGELISSEKTKKEVTVNSNNTDTGISWHNLVEWKIRILKTIKGDQKTGSIISIVAPQVDLPHSLKSDQTCLQSLNFEPSKKYMIFEDSYNPAGYKSLMPNDGWETEIRKNLK